MRPLFFHSDLTDHVATMKKVIDTALLTVGMASCRLGKGKKSVRNAAAIDCHFSWLILSLT